MRDSQSNLLVFVSCFLKSNFVFLFQTLLVAVVTKPVSTEGLANQEPLDLVDFPLTGTDVPKLVPAKAMEAVSGLLISQPEFGLN